MSNRKSIPPSLRSQILIANRHACCVCGGGDVQIHHINGNSSDNKWENLAVLCLEHHNKATAPKNLTAALTSAQIVTYKKNWEDDCKKLSYNLARSRTSFFMVDYKNAERIRQLYSQLTLKERMDAYEQLKFELKEEDTLRRQQGFDVSIEPTTAWSPLVEKLIEEIRIGNAHPEMFHEAKGHPKDPLYPDVHAFESPPLKPMYDIWCQIMVRCLIISRKTYDMNNITATDEPSSLSLSGALVSFIGDFRGKVYYPEEYSNNPLSYTVLRVKNESSTWVSKIRLKTHYLYSTTAADFLSKGRENGVLIFRSIDEVRKTRTNTRVKFSCSPLIIGNGTLQID